jgi:carboxylate-amine ligase
VQLEFHASQGMTLGVEWELGLVDPTSGDLVSRAEEVLDALGPLGSHTSPHEQTGPSGEQAATAAGTAPTPPQPRVVKELMLNTVELVTGVCRNADEATSQLARMLAAVRGAACDLGIEVFSAGAHPYARWEDQRVSDGARYATLIERTQWWGRQMLIYGLHVHVGIPHRAAVLPVINAMLTYQPHLQALSASSPFWAGMDTGYASNRALMFQQLPTAGLPFQFETWAQYEAYLDDVFTTGVIDDVSELRWDLRPSPRIGTIEVRVADAAPTLLEVTALSALTHCLVVDVYERLSAGERLPVLPPWHVQENKWRAARYGTEAIVICDEASAERLVTDELSTLLERLSPLARRLGCESELRNVEDVLGTGPSYVRQRKAAARGNGDLRAVIAHLVREMAVGQPLAAARAERAVVDPQT